MTKRQQTTVNDDTLRRNIGVSAGLHFGVLLFLYFGLPVFVKPLPTPSVPIPIDIVDISDITNTRLKEQPEEPPKPPEPPPKPEEKVAPPPPQPTPPPPQAQPTPPQPPPPEAKPEQVEAIMPAQKPPEKKPPPPKPEKPKVDQLASVLKNVEKMKPAEAVKTPTPAKTQSQTQAQPKSTAPSLSDRLTMTEEDALRRQVEQCWSPPIGARNAQTLVVEVNIVVNPDRTVQSAEVVDKNRLNSDPYFRSAAEAAIRALYNPRCNPLELPEGKYEQWKRIDFNFDPRDML